MEIHAQPHNRETDGEQVALAEKHDRTHHRQQALGDGAARDAQKLSKRHP
ncbi:MAG: hypothetical protein IPK50_06505 [Fibrobacterota bacterium]|nr:MAG: hypothetical protein IPK50_06505 [Fibrobacterota bacterium]